MFQPVSLKGGSPSPIDENIRNKYLFIYIIIIIISFFPGIIFEYFYFIYFLDPQFFWILLLLFPINFLIFFYGLQFSAILISVLLLKICMLIYPPKEGIFKRNIHDKNYFFWNIRNVIKKWPLFLMASNPFPWLTTRFVLRFFGVKIGKNCICDNSWISSEFVEIRDNVIIGMSSIILTFGVEEKTFIIKKIIIKENALIGAKCVIMPGTIVEEKVKLSAHSYTNYDQILNKGSIYLGHPAKLKQLKKDNGNK
ncbi:MAG: DapH/DapD/GlmU-related protein [Candidatus Lokiarchaeota archaeon]